MLGRLNTALRKVSDLANKAAEKACIALVGILVVAILIGVFYRYVLGRGLPWPEELARALNIWVAYLGASIGVKFSEHVGIDLFVGLLPDKVRAVFKFFTRLLVVAFLSVIAYYCFRYTATARSTTPAMQISVKWINSALFVGFSIMLIHLVSFIVNDLHAFVSRQFPSTAYPQEHHIDGYQM